jgi:CDP-paratose 2-epimerase
MKTVITGGSGFIGSSAARRFLQQGHEVVVIDNFSRRGSRNNIEWLKRQGPLEVCEIDLRDRPAVCSVFKQHADAGLILHLAAQVAVTTSVADPVLDFEVNATGTFNLLEAVRVAGIRAPLIYSSTNKVYGEMPDLEIAEVDGRYRYASLPNGISEERMLDFHSPYGCSKGAADQYVRDYHRIFGLNTVVMRQSCIYGPRQFGIEDQGWVAWFMIAAECKKPITIYGDGKQVRDILYVEDLLDAFEAAAANIKSVAGKVFNLGGGPSNAVSLLDVLGVIQECSEAPLPLSYADARPGDQLVYISDIRLAQRALGWKPKIQWLAGLKKLQAWVREHRKELA